MSTSRFLACVNALLQQSGRRGEFEPQTKLRGKDEMIIHHAEHYQEPGVCAWGNCLLVFGPAAGHRHRGLIGAAEALKREYYLRKD